MVYWQHCGALVVFVGIPGTAIGLDVVDDGEVDDGNDVYSEEGLTQVVGWSRARHCAGDVPLWALSQSGETATSWLFVDDGLAHIERELLPSFRAH